MEKKVQDFGKSIFIRINFTGDIKAANKLALFDMDGTLIKYPVHQQLSTTTRWEFLYDNTLSMLRDLDSNGFFVGIVSNQLGLGGFKKSFVKKLDEFLSRFDFQVLFIGSMRHDYFRKPLPGSFEYLKRKYFRNVELYSFYVGDAAGRVSGGARDHSSCDIKFAYNCNIEFFTPEAFFKGEKNVKMLTPFDPRSYAHQLQTETHKKILVVFGKGKHSGKAFFLNKYFPSYEFMKDGTGPRGKSSKEKLAFLDVQSFAEIACLSEEHGPENILCIFLDYSQRVIHYLRSFSKVTGKASRYRFRSHEFKKFFEPIHTRNENDDHRRSRIKSVFFGKFCLELAIEDFFFDDSSYSSFEKKVSRFQL